MINEMGFLSLVRLCVVSVDEDSDPRIVMAAKSRKAGRAPPPPPPKYSKGKKGGKYASPPPPPSRAATRKRGKASRYADVDSDDDYEGGPLTPYGWTGQQQVGTIKIYSITSIYILYWQKQAVLTPGKDK